MKFNAVQVKHVMQKTGAAEWDCRRALAERDGDVAAAIRSLFETSQVILEGVQVYDWWRVADERLFTDEQAERVRGGTGADTFTCERALAETGGDVDAALALARKYRGEKET